MAPIVEAGRVRALPCVTGLQHGPGGGNHQHRGSWGHRVLSSRPPEEADTWDQKAEGVIPRSAPDHQTTTGRPGPSATVWLLSSPSPVHCPEPGDTSTGSAPGGQTRQLLLLHLTLPGQEDGQRGAALLEQPLHPGAAATVQQVKHHSLCPVSSKHWPVGRGGQMVK